MSQTKKNIVYRGIMADPTTLLPPEYTTAATYLQNTFNTRELPMEGSSSQSLGDTQVSVSKGFDVRLWKPDANKDIIRITLKSQKLVDSKIADATSKMVLNALHELPAVRNEVILLPPAEYVADVKKRLGKLLNDAKAAGIPGSDFDYTQSSVLDTSFSGNQIPNYGTQLIESPTATTIRINIPTNPTQLDKAMETAKKVEADLNKRLPEIKGNIIKHIMRKKYVTGLDDAAQKKLNDHEFKVNIQQQANWTSVFIDVRSPEQQAIKENPALKTEPSQLQKTNMFSQISDQEKRFKTASRAVLFEGEDLKKPAAIFNDVAGVLDLDAGIGKVLHYLGKAKPELKPEIDALLKENMFKRREQWNLPPEQQQEEKRLISGQIDPKYPDTMEFTFTVPKGKADGIIKNIASLVPTAEQPPMAKVEETAVGAITPSMQEKALAAAIKQVLEAYQPVVGQSR